MKGVCSRPSPLAWKDVEQPIQYGSVAASDVSAPGRIMALGQGLAVFATAAGLQNCLYSVCHANSPNRSARRSRWREWLRCAVADYPSLAISKIGDRNTSRALQSKDRLAGAIPSEKHDAGGLECLAHGKQLSGGWTATTLKRANTRFAQITFCSKPHRRTGQPDTGRVTCSGVIEATKRLHCFWSCLELEAQEHVLLPANSEGVMPQDCRLEPRLEQR